MEMSRTRMEGFESGSREREGWNRDTVRAITHRRAERRTHDLVRGLRERSRVLGRTVALRYVIQENPGRTVLVSFLAGLLVGTVSIALRQITQDFQDVIAEEERSEESEVGTRAAA